MNAVSTEIIIKAADVLGTTGISEGEIEIRVAGLVSDPLTARRLIDWIPEAFGLVLVSHFETVVLPQTFSARNARGQWESFPFAREPIFVVAIRIAQTDFHGGPRERFQNIATRSSTLNSVNNALHAGASLDGSVLSGPALVSIPAEVYSEQRKSLWKRLFH